MRERPYLTHCPHPKSLYQKGRGVWGEGKERIISEQTLAKICCRNPVSEPLGDFFPATGFVALCGFE